MLITLFSGFQVESKRYSKLETDNLKNKVK